MKKRNLLGLLGAALLATLLVTSANAQTFVASFGVQHHWRVPMVVSHYIDDYYYNYNWVHTRQIAHHGSIDYEIVLQRGGVFVELTIDTFGRVFRTVRRDYYPLNEHICGSYCGYHTNYYNAYYTACHSHSHHGHNHVKYYNRPNGYAYGHYKNHGHKQYNTYSNGHKKEYRDDRKSPSNRYPTRRGEYHKVSDRSNGRTSKGSYNSREGDSERNERRVVTTVSRKSR